MTTCRIRIVGRKGSKSCAAIIENTLLKRYAGKKYKTDVLVNYGLSGQKLKAFYNKNPLARNIPMVNRHIGYSKFDVVARTQRHNILVPESRLELRKIVKYFEQRQWRSFRRSKDKCILVRE